MLAPSTVSANRRALGRASLAPARLDFLQSASGLALGLFMWGHMFFVSSILLGKDAMWTITKLFEGYFFFGRAYPGIVSFVVACVIVLFVAHAFLALRKFPIDYRQYRLFRTHMANRIEKDFLGEKELPETAYYGVQTQRGKENFHITGIPMSLEPNFVKAFGYVKKAAALANRDLGVLDPKIADAIAGACDRLIAGEMRDQFVTDFIQGGAGTSTNMALPGVSALLLVPARLLLPAWLHRRRCAPRLHCGRHHWRGPVGQLQLGWWKRQRQCEPLQQFQPHQYRGRQLEAQRRSARSGAVPRQGRCPAVWASSGGRRRIARGVSRSCGRWAADDPAR